MKKKIRVLTLLSVCLSMLLSLYPAAEKDMVKGNEKKKTIGWVDFSPTAAAMKEAASLDMEAQKSGGTLDWIALLAYYATRKGGSFAAYRTGDLKKIAEDAASQGKTVEECGNALEGAKTFRYYCEAYDAVLHDFLGYYTDENGAQQYGIRAFSPFAEGFYYSEYDDFGASRSYGYKRRHLGHDMMGQIGTPIIAIQSGYVENCGWNQYGGWRIGIRSFDGKRFTYYAHLKKNHPYCDIYEGKIVTAGEVIGYLGMTGYSAKENVNNINVPHLHLGMELIFAPEQKDGYCQIWIDMYQITKFLAPYRSAVQKKADGKDYIALHPIIPDNMPD